MATQNFNSQEEMDEHFEMIEEVNFKHLQLKEDIVDREQDLKDAEKELADFEEDNKEYLV